MAARAHSPPKKRRLKGARIVDDDALQQKEHEEGIFGAIHAGDLAAVLRLVADDPSKLDERDPVGAAPVHVAFLYGQYEIGQELVSRYVAPVDQALLEYDESGSYGGENVLHIVIVNQNLAMAEWLLERMPELLNSEATGEFFKPCDDAYFGGYPLLFAVATNQEDMLDAILATATLKRSEACVTLRNSIFLQDRFDNTALHLAVIHDLPDMYDYVLRIAEAEETYLEHEVPFRNWANKDQLTPLSLAAALGKEEMFRHLLSKHTKAAWKYGPVVCQMIPLLGLEQPAMTRDDEGKLRRGPEILAMDCVCAGPYAALSNCIELVGSKVPQDVEQGRLAIVSIPAVRQLLETKWELFGRRIFLRKLAMVMATQILWTVAMVLPHHWRLDEGNLWAYPAENGVAIACESLVLLLTFWRLINEGQEMVARGVGYFTRANGAAAMDNGLGLAFYVSYTLMWVLRLCKQPEAEDVFASLAALVGWGYMFFFLLGFRSTGPFIIMIQEMVVFDMRRFGSVYAAVLLAFTSALYLVRYSTAPDVVTFFATMKEILLLGLVGEFDFDAWNDGTNAWLLTVLVIVYIIFVNIMLINLLIAMMGNTYDAINETAELRWYIERANIMSSFEGELSLEEMQARRSKYAVPLGSKPNKQGPSAVTELYLKVTTKAQLWKDETKERQRRVRATKAARRAGPPPSAWLLQDLEEREALARAAVVESQEDWRGYLEQAAAMLAAHSVRHPAALADHYPALSPSVAALHPRP
eukprot:EG_transcript_3837